MIPLTVSVSLRMATFGVAVPVFVVTSENSVAGFVSQSRHTKHGTAAA